MDVIRHPAPAARPSARPGRPPPTAPNADPRSDRTASRPRSPLNGSRGLHRTAAKATIRRAILLAVHRWMLENDPSLRLADLYHPKNSPRQYLQNVLHQAPLLHRLRGDARDTVNDLMNPSTLNMSKE